MGVGMLSKDDSHQALRALFDKKRVADLKLLFATLDTRSRMSVFRRLREMGYFSSYTHTGRYYTLADIPEFDEYDLWHYQAIGFSRLGTLRATVAHQVEKAEAGCTHAELESLLRVRVYNTVRELARSGEIGRESVGGSYLYLSADEHRAGRQLDVRRQQMTQLVKPSRSLPAQEVVVAVLVEALQASEGLALASVVAGRLAARGRTVSVEQVQRVYEHFGLQAGKKTAAPR
jgi:hypothetical protein